MRMAILAAVLCLCWLSSGCVQTSGTQEINVGGVKRSETWHGYTQFPPNTVVAGRWYDDVYYPPVRAHYYRRVPRYSCYGDYVDRYHYRYQR